MSIRPRCHGSGRSGCVEGGIFLCDATSAGGEALGDGLVS